MSRPLLHSLDPVLRRVRDAPRVLLALDFDGTLAPIVPRPEQAALPPATASVLRRFVAGDGAGRVAIVSGRSIADLKRRAALDCTYVGNHGLEIEGPGISFFHREAVQRRPALDYACADLDAALEGFDSAFVERKGLSATVHFREAAAELHDEIRAIVENVMRPYAPRFDVLPARKALEIRPRVGWCKGAALRLLADHYGDPRPLVICAGDDVADETMFQAAPDGISIRVGGHPETAAQFCAAGPAELAEFLEQLPLG